MKKHVFTLLMGVFIGAMPVYSQPGMQAAESTMNAMEKLSFLEGNWTGKGWIQMGQEKHQFVQEETVTRKVNSTVLVIDGKGVNPETDQVIHLAFAVISFDAANDKYLMRAFRADGNYRDAEARVDPDGNFVWGFSIEQVGEVRYTTSLEEDKWVETGEMNRGGTWFPFFGMTLTRQ